MTVLPTYLTINLFVFLLMWLDKRQAQRGRRRISECSFFLWALLFGAAGVWLGMYVFRHKTKHMAFVMGIPALLVVNLILGYLLMRL